MTDLSTPDRCDLLIRGGHIIDGTASKSFLGDIAIVGDRICAIGQLREIHADHLIDATGYAVAPGFITTDMTKELDSEPILAAIPLGSFGTPEQVAGAVRFLAADPAAAYITGQVLQVDGGMLMG